MLSEGSTVSTGNREEDPAEVSRLFKLCISSKEPGAIITALRDGRVTLESVYQQYTLLHMACMKGRLSLVHALLQLGADANKQSEVILLPTHPPTCRSHRALVASPVVFTPPLCQQPERGFEYYQISCSLSSRCRFSEQGRSCAQEEGTAEVTDQPCRRVGPHCESLSVRTTYRGPYTSSKQTPISTWKQTTAKRPCSSCTPPVSSARFSLLSWRKRTHQHSHIYYKKINEELLRCQQELLALPPFAMR